MTTVVHRLYNINRVAKLNVVNQYLQAVYAKEIKCSATKFGFMSVDM
jgi:hypothetical protein